MQLIVHVILNSHLDPVWLWTRPQGIDEVLSTARTACEVLERNGEIHITRGEAWFYDTVRRHDARLFRRIRRHVQAGRWHIVGGWWIQPDCNLPTAEGFRRQGRMGQEFFRKHFGQPALTGYNVDSFGHAATLPDLYASAGISQYVMMRPQAHEKTLPSNLFTWESPSGARMTTFRISPGYTTGWLFTKGNMTSHLDACIAAADRRVGHTMCFVGIGDHGGGPIQEEIDWVKAHRDYAPDVRLVFSHPDAFFDAVRASRVELPVVRDELQMHAVGCYTVVHAVKQGMRRAEDLAAQAECLAASPLLPAAARKRITVRLEEAWRHILFNQFHDILAGSAIRPAYDWAADELGVARTACRDIIVDVTRVMLLRLPPDKCQQVLLVNASSAPFDGYVEMEPWVVHFRAHFGESGFIQVTDEAGKPVPSQRLRPESAMHVERFLVRVAIPAGGQRILRMDYCAGQQDLPSGVSWSGGVLSNNAAVALTPGPEGIASLSLDGLKPLVAGAGIRAVVLHDHSDTWSHDREAFREEQAGCFAAAAPWLVHPDAGPLRITLKNEMAFARSSLLWRVFLNAGERIARLRLRVTWHDEAKVMKLRIPPAFAVTRRLDGCPGGVIERPCNGKEHPFHNFTALAGKDGRGLAVVSRDVFGLDVAPDGTVGLTLLRCPPFAHDPSLTIVPGDVFPVTDQGVHEYELALLPFDGRDLADVEAEVHRQAEPVWMAETTRGMAQRRTIEQR